MHLDVPERWLYAQDVEELVRNQLSRKLRQESMRIVLKAPKKHRSYVYKASFVLRY